MFLANPRVQRMGQILIRLALLIYGLSLILGAHHDLFDHILGALIILCSLTGTIAGLLARRSR